MSKLIDIVHPQNRDRPGWCKNGEFHTLVTKIPRFSKHIEIEVLIIDRSSRFHVQEYRHKSKLKK